MQVLVLHEDDAVNDEAMAYKECISNTNQRNEENKEKVKAFLTDNYDRLSPLPDKQSRSSVFIK